MENIAQIKQRWYQALAEIVGQPLADEQLATKAQERTWAALEKKRGAKFIILTGPSGAGKGFVGELLEKEGIERFVAHATRKPRASDIPGKTYHFVNEDVFRQMVDRGEFIWYVIESNRPEHHGVGVNQFFGPIKQGKRFYIDAGNRTATQLPFAPALKKVSFLFIMVLPPTFDELVDRLKARQTQEGQLRGQGVGGEQMSDEEISRRLARAIPLLQDTQAFVDIYLVSGEKNELVKKVHTIAEALNG